MTSEPQRRPRTFKPWFIPPTTNAEIFAIQAFAAGTATPDQQRLAWSYIREKLCDSERISFWPGGEDGRRATDFAEGKRSVAVALRRLIRMAPAEIDPRGPPPPIPGAPADDERDDDTGPAGSDQEVNNVS